MKMIRRFMINKMMIIDEMKILMFIYFFPRVLDSERVRSKVIESKRDQLLNTIRACTPDRIKLSCTFFVLMMHLSFLVSRFENLEIMFPSSIY